VNINRVSVTSLALSGASLLGALGIRRPRILRAISFSERLSLVIPLAMVGSLIGTLRVARTCHFVQWRVDQVLFIATSGEA